MKLLPTWKDIQEKLVQRRDEEGEQKLKSRIADEIVRRNDFEVPPSMVDNALNRLWEDYQKQPEKQPDEEQYKEENRSSVVWRIKWHLTQQAIIQKEEIMVTEEEVDTEIDKMVEASPKEDKKIRSWFKTPQRRERLKDNLLEERVMAFLKDHAKVKETHLKPPKKSIITT